MKYYVYILRRPDGRPFYVGKGSGRRYQDHEREAKKHCECHRCCVIRKIWRDGEKVVIDFVFRTDDEDEAFQQERKLISLIGIKYLTNVTNGGRDCRFAKKSRHDNTIRPVCVKLTKLKDSRNQIKPRVKVIDLDGIERTIPEMMKKYDLTRRTIEYRLEVSEDGKRVFRPARKAGRKPKRQHQEEASK